VLKNSEIERPRESRFARIGSSRPIVVTAGHIGGSRAAKPIRPPKPLRNFPSNLSAVL
jgi:hypothetical protein